MFDSCEDMLNVIERSIISLPNDIVDTNLAAEAVLIHISQLVWFRTSRYEIGTVAANRTEYLESKKNQRCTWVISTDRVL